jgi:hypothetical protein
MTDEVETILRAAIGAGLRNVLIISELSIGPPYVATSGNLGVGDALLLMERAKQHLISVHESYMEDTGGPKIREG